MGSQQETERTVHLPAMRRADGLWRSRRSVGGIECLKEGLLGTARSVIVPFVIRTLHFCASPCQSTSIPSIPLWNLCADSLAQGDRTDFEMFSDLHNGHNWPVTIEVTNDVDAHQVTFRFVSDTVDVECVYDDVFDANTALTAAISPDVSTKDDLQIYSLSVASMSSPHSLHPLVSE